MAWRKTLDSAPAHKVPKTKKNMFYDPRLRLFALINSEEKPFKLKPLAVLDFHSEVKIYY